VGSLSSGEPWWTLSPSGVSELVCTGDRRRSVACDSVLNEAPNPELKCSALDSPPSAPLAFRSFLYTTDNDDNERFCHPRCSRCCWRHRRDDRHL